MARNQERDAREEQRRRRQLLDAGFRLFSARGIESVSLQEVATEADVGVATLYKYYETKAKLVIAISASMWQGVREKAFALRATEDMNAQQYLEFFADQLILLYSERPDVLRFSSNFKTFIRRENVSEELLADQMNALAPIDATFHAMYEQAKTDGSIRTDLPEREIFSTFALTMLCMAERYAQGIVWADSREHDHVR